MVDREHRMVRVGKHSSDKFHCVFLFCRWISFLSGTEGKNERKAKKQIFKRVGLRNETKHQKRMEADMDCCFGYLFNFNGSFAFS